MILIIEFESLELINRLCDGHSLCSLSSRNVAAFTTTTELDDYNGRTWGSHVYICDLNMPWHSYKLVENFRKTFLMLSANIRLPTDRVLSNKSNITALEWDLPGDKLVVADESGSIQLWTFKDHILNDWTSIGSACFPGEHILSAAWFHNGKKASERQATNLFTDYNDRYSIFRSD